MLPSTMRKASLPNLPVLTLDFLSLGQGFHPVLELFPRRSHPRDNLRHGHGLLSAGRDRPTNAGKLKPSNVATRLSRCISSANL